MTWTCPDGLVRIEFRDVPAQDRPDLPAGGRRTEGFTLLEQNYEFDLLSRDRILQKYVGRDLSWIQDDGTAVTGTLLGLNDGPVYRVDGRIVFEVPGRLALPDLPADLRDRPTLVWLAENGPPGQRKVEASYLTGGLSWKADYVLDLDRDGQAGRSAGLGDGRQPVGRRLPRRHPAPGGRRREPGHPAAAARSCMADMPWPPRPKGGFSEQALYDYHLYTLDRPTDLKDRQIKQISLFERDGVAVAKHYRLRAGRRPSAADGTQAVEVAYRFANNEAAGLGLPLPGGHLPGLRRVRRRPAAAGRGPHRPHAPGRDGGPDRGAGLRPRGRAGGDARPSGWGITASAWACG